MLQPTQQQCIPVQIVNGVFGEGTATVTLDSTYDHVIEFVHIKNAGGAAGSVTLQDDDGDFMIEYDLAVSAEVFDHPQLVLQSQTEIKLVFTMATVGLTISATRLAPSAASIFG